MQNSMNEVLVTADWNKAYNIFSTEEEREKTSWLGFFCIPSNQNIFLINT